MRPLIQTETWDQKQRVSWEGAWLGPTVDCVAAFSGQ